MFLLSNKFKFFKKINLLTITDLTLKNNQIYCSYNISLATRMHHLPVVDEYKLPRTIINSFALNYFSYYEEEFIYICDACNKTLNFTFDNPNCEYIKLSTGKQISITVYTDLEKSKFLEFRINDLSKFIGLCRRYKDPAEVENLLTYIFKTRGNI